MVSSALFLMSVIKFLTSDAKFLMSWALPYDPTLPANNSSIVSAEAPPLLFQ